MLQFGCQWLDIFLWRPRIWTHSVKFIIQERDFFSPKWVCGSRWESPLKSWETLNLFSSDLNVGGNTEMHWSVSNKAALPAWHSEGERGYFAPWQQVTSIWNCQQTLIGLLKHIGCNVRDWLPGGRAPVFSSTGAVLTGCQQTWLIGND